MTDLLKKVDRQVCQSPKKILDFYTKDMVIFSDSNQVLVKDRIKAYESMIADHQGIKCSNKRTVLIANVSSNLAFLLVDELINVSFRHSTDERQHSVCTYGFTKKGGRWKIKHEHCSSLPEYTITPGDDALYYYHNPVGR